MNNNNEVFLSKKQTQWLSVMAFVFAQQHHHIKAIPILLLLKDSNYFSEENSVQLAYSLYKTNKFLDSKSIVEKALKNDIQQEHKLALRTIYRSSSAALNKTQSPSVAEIHHEE